MNIQLSPYSRLAATALPRRTTGPETEAGEPAGASQDLVTLSAAAETPEPSAAKPGSAKLKRSAWKATWLAVTAAVGMMTLVGCVPPPAQTHDAPARDAIEHVESKVPPTFQKQTERPAPTTELEVKVRELELRERELALREKEVARNDQLDASQKRVNDLRARQIQRQEAEKKAERIADGIEGGAKLLELLGGEVNKVLR